MHEKCKQKGETVTTFDAYWKASKKRQQELELASRKALQGSTCSNSKQIKKQKDIRGFFL
jgi:hypothetical protein